MSPSRLFVIGFFVSLVVVILKDSSKLNLAAPSVNMLRQGGVLPIDFLPKKQLAGPVSPVKCCFCTRQLCYPIRTLTMISVFSYSAQVQPLFLVGWAGWVG